AVARSYCVMLLAILKSFILLPIFFFILSPLAIKLVYHKITKKAVFLKKYLTNNQNGSNIKNK
ncbi:hypothetical protein D1841_18135, partial [Neglecta sp. X4]|nr:hypothetical protein [Neglectibacter sp. X4]